MSVDLLPGLGLLVSVDVRLTPGAEIYLLRPKLTFRNVRIADLTLTRMKRSKSLLARDAFRYDSPRSVEFPINRKNEKLHVRCNFWESYRLRQK